MAFTVIDTKTGQYPDTWKIACKEEWAKCLCYCDMEGFAIKEDGTLVLLDECGKVAYCPEGRFQIIPEPQWISVTDKEHFPNTDHGVVGYFGGGAFNQLRWYDFVTILSDGAIVGESTERDVINEHCIAVYKLPDPPKEGE